MVYASHALVSTYSMFLEGYLRRIKEDYGPHVIRHLFIKQYTLVKSERSRMICTTEKQSNERSTAASTEDD